jgi:hypothetical protein
VGTGDLMRGQLEDARVAAKGAGRDRDALLTRVTAARNVVQEIADADPAQRDIVWAKARAATALALIPAGRPNA